MAYLSSPKPKPIIDHPKNNREYRDHQKQENGLALYKKMEEVETQAQEHGYKLPSKKDFETLEISRVWSNQAYQEDQENGKKHEDQGLLDLPTGQVQTFDGVTHKAVIFFPKSLYDKMNFLELNHFDHILVGGQIKSLSGSPVKLPKEIQRAARRETHEYALGARTHLMVSIKGQMKYIVPSFSLFASWGNHTGSMVDPKKWEILDPFRPTLSDLVMPDYVEKTAVICEEERPKPFSWLTFFRFWNIK